MKYLLSVLLFIPFIGPTTAYCDESQNLVYIEQRLYELNYALENAYKQYNYMSPEDYSFEVGFLVGKIHAYIDCYELLD